MQIPFLDFYYFLLVIEYTGIPINVIIIPPKAINVAVNNWFIITNKPPIIAIAGIIGYKGTLYGLCNSGLSLRSLITPINVST